jgi:hypothetical protein
MMMGELDSCPGGSQRLKLTRQVGRGSYGVVFRG